MTSLLLAFEFSRFIECRIVPSGSQEGITIIQYSKESFTNETSRYISANVNIQGGRANYNSFKATGSFCPTVSGVYNFKTIAKRNSQIWFMNSYSNDMSWSYKCDSGDDNHTTGDYSLIANKCYPIRVFMKTGCSLYKYKLELYVQFNGGSYQLASNFISTEYSGCMPGYYGDLCLPPATPSRTLSLTPITVRPQCHRQSQFIKR